MKKRQLKKYWIFHYWKAFYMPEKRIKKMIMTRRKNVNKVFRSKSNWTKLTFTYFIPRNGK